MEGQGGGQGGRQGEDVEDQGDVAEGGADGKVEEDGGGEEMEER